jgi:hypothetical protein
VNGSNNVFNTNLRLNKVAVGAHSFAGHTLVVRAKGSHHDNLNVFGFGGRTQNV